MINEEHRAWDECPDADCCELISSFLELVDAMVKDIQHLSAETVRARYELSRTPDPDHKWITSADLLSDLYTPQYDSLAYQEYIRLYYDGGDPMGFKRYTDLMDRIANGIDDGRD